jgi:hypothetical protein
MMLYNKENSLTYQQLIRQKQFLSKCSMKYEAIINWRDATTLNLYKPYRKQMSSRMKKLGQLLKAWKIRETLVFK